MPTPIAAIFTDDDIAVVFREPMTSAPLNRKFAGVIPAGIFRGFKMTPAVAARTLTLEADPETGDHLAVLETSTGFSLTLRKAGDLTVNLAAFAGTTVVLALYVDYTAANETELIFYKFSVAEIQALTAEQLLELVIIGTIDVPAGNVAIPEASIHGTYRTPAWYRSSKDQGQWRQMVRNGGFEWATRDTPDNHFALFWQSQITVGPGQWMVRNSVPNSHSGAAHLVLRTTDGTNNPITGWVTQLFYTPVVPGQLYKIEFWYNAVGIPTSGDAYVQVDYLGVDAVDFSNESFLMITDGSAMGWTKFSETVRIPESVYWIRSVTIIAGMLVYGSGPLDLLRVDDISLWVEPDGAADPVKERLWPTEAVNALVFGGYTPAENGFVDSQGAIRWSPFSADAGRWVVERYDEDTNPDTQLTWDNRGYEQVGNNLATSFHNGVATRTEKYRADANGFSFVRSFVANTVEDGSMPFREYIGSAGEHVWTTNARWTGSLWTKDDDDYPAYKLVFAGWSNIAGSTFLRVAYYQRSADGTWTDAGPDPAGWETEMFKSDANSSDLRMSLAGAIQLGTGLTTAAQAEFPRIKGGYSDTIRIFLEEFATSGTRWRRYTNFDDGVSKGDIIWTYNAYWDASASQWTKDDNGIQSGMIKFFGGEQPSFQLLIKGTGTPFVDNDWTTVVRLSSNTESLLNNLRIHMGTPTTDGNPANTTGISNELCAATLVKGYGNIKVAANAIVGADTEGINFTATLDTVTFAPANALVIAFPAGGRMADTKYSVQASIDIVDGPAAIATPVIYNRLTTGFTILLAQNNLTLTSINNMRIMFTVTGKQTTGA